MSEELQKKLEQMKNIRMSAEGRLRVREKLAAYASFHKDVIIGTEERSMEYIQQKSVWSPVLFKRITVVSMKATLLAALLVVGGGGTMAAAQGAVPGDALYPVKIHVNENLRSAFAVGANAEARLHADLLRERVEETEKLASRGALSAEAAAEAETRISTQAEAASSAAAHADVDVSAEVRTEIAAALNDLRAEFASHKETLSLDVSARIDAALTAALNTVANGSTATQLAGESNVDAQFESAVVRYDSLKTVIDEHTEIDAEARASFEADLETAAAHIADARASLAADVMAAAEASIAAAAELLGKIEAALSSMGSVEIDTDTGAIIDIDLGGEGTSSTDTESSIDVSGDTELNTSVEQETEGALNIGS